MKLKFVLKGKDYSTNKDEFKKLLTKYGFKWRGTQSNFVWRSSTEAVHAFFERDDATDTTISATLVWSGKKESPFLKDLKKWAAKLKCKPVKMADKDVSKDVEMLIQKELEFWDKIYKPNVEYLRSISRPEAWIKLDISNWKRARKQKEKELREQYTQFLQ
jgi:hypothetical protein